MIRPADWEDPLSLMFVASPGNSPAWLEQFASELRQSSELAGDTVDTTQIRRELALAHPKGVIIKSAPIPVVQCRDCHGYRFAPQEPSASEFCISRTLRACADNL